ncbi:unnamed protein product [Prunus brigantina]
MLLEPSSDVPEPSLSSNPPAKFTSLEQQVVDLKKRYPYVLLMVEVDYKYRFFGQDTEIAARVLGIYAHMETSGGNGREEIKGRGFGSHDCFLFFFNCFLILYLF